MARALSRVLAVLVSLALLLPQSTGATGRSSAQYAETANLPGGGAARVRVIASDGFSSSSYESDAAFSVALKGPNAIVVSPARGAEIRPGGSLVLQGYAYDPQDGLIEDSAVMWTSSVDGRLGTGLQPETRLSPGEHEITLAATDSDGTIGTATVRVYAGYRQMLPPVVRR